jgi:Icc protein
MTGNTREACTLFGSPRLDENRFAPLPFFACKAAGEALARVMAEHPDRRLTVFCGHTHGKGRCRVSSNIEVITGGAEYGRPRLQEVIEID